MILRFLIILISFFEAFLKISFNFIIFYQVYNFFQIKIFFFLNCLIGIASKNSFPKKITGPFLIFKIIYPFYFLFKYFFFVFFLKITFFI
jgi:hypothetical protein